MNPRIQSITMRPGQTIQCSVCHKMNGELWAYLDGKPFESFFCRTCLNDITALLNKKTAKYDSKKTYLQNVRGEKP